MTNISQMMSSEENLLSTDDHGNGKTFSDICSKDASKGQDDRHWQTLTYFGQGGTQSGRLTCSKDASKGQAVTEAGRGRQSGRL